tara:strand:+ start:72 stop:257 length:186 start_codon:yes stop_codon:yes gene_type:complete
MTTCISLHRVKNITKKIHKSKDGSAWLELTAIDENGYKTEITFFADDMQSLSIIENGYTQE